MKKYLLLLLAMLAGNAAAFDFYNGVNTAGIAQWSSTSVIVNGTDGKPALQQDMIDNVNSSQTTRTFGYVFGRAGNLQNVRCDLWEGPTCVYVFPATAQQMALTSGSANDAAAGTGCQQVMVHYLDNLYAVQQETVTLNGVTPVNTVATNILRINSMHCIRMGSGGTTVGPISLKNTAGTVTYSYISAGFDTARQAIYTVPAGYYGYIAHWQASAGAPTGSHFTQISVRATAHEGIIASGVFLLIDEVGLLNNASTITLPTPIRIPPTTDVKVSAIADAANAGVVATGAVMGWFEKQ